MELLRKLKAKLAFLSTREDINLGPPYLIETDGNIEVGNGSYHNGNFRVKGVDKVKIGNYCAFGQDIKIILTNHNYLLPCMQYSFYLKKFGKLPYPPTGTIVNIGSDVWIGDNVIILPGISIGDGAIIGGGSVVTKDVAPFTIVAGNPAKLIRKRFSDQKITEMLQIKWWNWTDEEIINNEDFFFSEQI